MWKAMKFYVLEGIGTVGLDSLKDFKDLESVEKIAYAKTPGKPRVKKQETEDKK